MSENYVKTVNIEGKLMSMMARTMILPAALRYQAEVAAAVNATKLAGVDNQAQVDLLKTLTATIGEFQAATSALDNVADPPRGGRPPQPRQVCAGCHSASHDEATGQRRRAGNDGRR